MPSMVTSTRLVGSFIEPTPMEVLPPGMEHGGSLTRIADRNVTNAVPERHPSSEDVSQ